MICEPRPMFYNTLCKLGTIKWPPPQCPAPWQTTRRPSLGPAWSPAAGCPPPPSSIVASSSSSVAWWPSFPWRLLCTVPFVLSLGVGRLYHQDWGYENPAAILSRGPLSESDAPCLHGTQGLPKKWTQHHPRPPLPYHTASQRKQHTALPGNG